MQDVAVEGVRQMFGGVPFYEGRNEILLLAKAKNSRNFSKTCIKINKIEKLLRKFREKFKIFGKVLIFRQS